MSSGWQGNSSNRVPFGLKDGRLHFVTQVETGLACGCVCPDPACNQPLIARNRPSPDRKRAYHFMHAAESSGCAGRESALHRMAKEVLLRASGLLLPAWRGDVLAIGEATLRLAGGSAAEVTLEDGQLRPDVLVGGLVDGIPLVPLYVEIRVHHAVDGAKAEKVRAARLNMLEIDVSSVTDDELVDPASFEQVVLHEAANRHWIHLDAASYFAARSGEAIYDIREATSFQQDVPIHTGNKWIVQKQRAVLYRGTDAPTPVDFELPSFVEPDGLRVDGYGNKLPYAPGLYVRNPAYERQSDRSHRFKTYLTPLRLVSTRTQPDLFCR